MVTIQQKSNGQYTVTIDKQVAEALDLEHGDKAEWKISSRNSLKLSFTGD